MKEIRLTVGQMCRLAASAILIRAILVLAALAIAGGRLRAQETADAPLLTVDQAVEIALANNRSLKVARLDVDKSKWQVAEIKTNRLPVIKSYIFAARQPEFSKLRIQRRNIRDDRERSNSAEKHSNSIFDRNRRFAAFSNRATDQPALQDQSWYSHAGVRIGIRKPGISREASISRGGCEAGLLCRASE